MFTTEGQGGPTLYFLHPVTLATTPPLDQLLTPGSGPEPKGTSK